MLDQGGRRRVEAAIATSDHHKIDLVAISSDSAGKRHALAPGRAEHVDASLVQLGNGGIDTGAGRTAVRIGKNEGASIHLISDKKAAEVGSDMGAGKDQHTRPNKGCKRQYKPNHQSETVASNQRQANHQQAGHRPEVAKWDRQSQHHSQQ